MSDDKNIREIKTASQINPVELPFTFIVPRQLLPVDCACPTAAPTAQHLNLPPSLGFWDPSDDMSADMYVLSAENYADVSFRSKIEYQVRVKVLSKVDRKSTVAAEAIEPVQILPLYSWWQSLRPQLRSESPTYERVEPPVGPPSESNPLNTVEAAGKIRKGFWGKRKGTVSVSIEVPDTYYINVGYSSGTSLSMPIKMRYSPISADLPPSVSSLSARLHARTAYNVDWRKDPRNSGVYTTNVTILKSSTPSTSTPLWLEDSSSSQLSFISNLLVPINLPPAAGSRTAKGDKVLLPSFESCLISRSYEIEIRIGFHGGSEVTLRIPTSIVAKPGTAAAQAAFDNAIQIADNWTPPGQEVVASEVEPELPHPTQFNLNIDDAAGSDTEGSMANSPTVETAPLPNEIVDTRSDLPPDYSVVITSINHKQVGGHRVIAVPA